MADAAASRSNSACVLPFPARFAKAVEFVTHKTGISRWGVTRQQRAAALLR